MRQPQRRDGTVDSGRSQPAGSSRCGTGFARARVPYAQNPDRPARREPHLHCGLTARGKRLAGTSLRSLTSSGVIGRRMHQFVLWLESTTSPPPPAVIPAKAGTQLTTSASREMNPCLRRDDTLRARQVSSQSIPSPAAPGTHRLAKKRRAARKATLPDFAGCRSCPSPSWGRKPSIRPEAAPNCRRLQDPSKPPISYETLDHLLRAG